jgi:hypothetical protein
MSEHHSGSCLCGAVKFEVTGGFQHFYLCHCRYCRKNTGTAHAANLFSTTAKLRWLSGESKTKTYSLPETRHQKCFCTECGAALPNIQMKGTLLVVPAGCLDSRLSDRPDAHLFIASKADWDENLGSVPEFEQFPVG